MKKTLNVALVVCLNVGVDPPDVVKIQPCARLECWIDPSSVSPKNALELIGKNLRSQYEQWQPRARFMHSLDPTVEDVTKVCRLLRRNAKKDRVLFHYNGHGVPRPTTKGEIWVFNETYTQYIPLSIYELQTYVGAPAVYVWDCSNAGTIVKSFIAFAEQHERELEENTNASSPGTSISGDSYRNCIQLAACGSDQILPMNPNLPADLFTACLTTPIKIAIKWFMLQKKSSLVPHVLADMIERIPGTLRERHTMLGELNWIFTAITDTIAWSTLPKDLFQKLFRHDLLLASLFRNFLLADRILRSYDCTPISSPALPESFRHPMWQSWDLVLDQTLSQLPDILENDAEFQHSPFFEDQLRAFEVWLESSSEKRSQPEQLPIVLQMLLSQVHRTRALELLGRFLDLGPWAVKIALGVGIFPYVLKLLQSSDLGLRPFLVFIWAKILAVDCSYQVDLISDEEEHKFFLDALQDPDVTKCVFSKEYHTHAAFVLASIVQNFPDGQAVALQDSLVSICLEQIPDHDPMLRQWSTICLGNLWQNFEPARWAGARDMAHEKLFPLLNDPVPAVRAAAVYALGTFISSVTQRTEHANTMDKSIAMTLFTNVLGDASPIVRMEILATLQWIVIFFESQFTHTLLQEINANNHSGGHHTHSLERNLNKKCVVRSSSISGAPVHLSIFHKLWNGFILLRRDPYPAVASLAGKIVDFVRQQTLALIAANEPAAQEERSISVSLPSSPNTHINVLGEPLPVHTHTSSGPTPSLEPSVGVATHDSQSSSISGSSEGATAAAAATSQRHKPIITTNYIRQSTSHFARQPQDKNSSEDLTRMFRRRSNRQVPAKAEEQQRSAVFARSKLQRWTGRMQGSPTVVKLHPHEPLIAVAYRDHVMLHDFNTNRVTPLVPAKPTSSAPHLSRYFKDPLATRLVRVTAMEFLEQTMTLVGYDNGTVCIWRTGDETTLVTAWQALGDAMVTAWQQSQTTLIVAGESRFARLWDTETELKVCEIPTGTGSSVGVLSCSESDIFVTGCADGSVRLFDRRLPPASARVKTYCEHKNPILTLSLRDQNDGLISACTNGDIRLYDIRRRHSLSHWKIPSEVGTLAIHPSANVISCGTQSISIYGTDGRHLNEIRSHEGFMGTRTAHATCMSFHQHKMSLAVGFKDHTVSVFDIGKKRVD